MMEYQRLGNYIREVNVRNTDLRVTELVGLTIDKAFIPSVANVIGTDLSSYKIIRKEQFACSLMQVSRDGKMPIAMFEKEEAIMSPAYPMFEVIDKTKLLPQYLMMWFLRKEFDREASFYAVGGVRGSLTWDDFCDMKLPIPSIDRQREIVAEYEAITNRINVNNQMIAKLEATAQAIYRKMFVDGIDKENMPDGWRIRTLEEVAKIVTGNLNSEDASEDGKYPFFTCSQETYRTDTYAFEQEAVLLAGNNASAIYPLKLYKGRFNAYQRTYVISSKCHAVCNKHIFFAIKGKLDDFKGTSQGTTTKFLTIKILNEIPIIIPDSSSHLEFSSKEEILFDQIFLLKQKNEKLTELQSLLLAKMGENYL